RLANFGVNDIRLSDRQAQVLHLLVDGKSNKEIAAVRGGSWYTARNIVRELLELFQVHSRSELVHVAITRGISGTCSVDRPAFDRQHREKGWSS
ncbi:MAG: Bacterial regulatory protein luxR family, partial [Candidatus Eremiobacteraeota bacterium]|nr:Bacterial regulatory protein luxR family [Candidatus Eremiobacteraeota bacterium]